jgi:hypothetical protein
LYLDDGDSIDQAATSEIQFEYEDGKLKVSGSFGYTLEETRFPPLLCCVVPKKVLHQCGREERKDGSVLGREVQGMMQRGVL